MSISDKTRKALEKIGLTSYEIRTFSALLKSGELTASDLSQKSGVPYSKIYEVLGTLEEKVGLVQMIQDRQNILQSLHQQVLKLQNKKWRQIFHRIKM
jgi:sugar-specific transcriptional regulator TrmB